MLEVTGVLTNLLLKLVIQIGHQGTGGFQGDLFLYGLIKSLTRCGHWGWVLQHLFMESLDIGGSREDTPSTQAYKGRGKAQRQREGPSQVCSRKY